MNFKENVTPTEVSTFENKPQPISSFNFEGKNRVVSFVKTMDVTDGVKCEIYAFTEDENKDLGIIKIEPGKKTPLQKVLKGKRTVEGYISGKGKLTITKPNGEKQEFVADGKSKKSIIVTVEIGETMQWEADKDSNLVAFEICFPPYENGRFENIG